MGAETPEVGPAGPVEVCVASYQLGSGIELVWEWCENEHGEKCYLTATTPVVHHEAEYCVE